MGAFAPAPPEEREAVLQKLEGLRINNSGASATKTNEGAIALESSLDPNEMRILNIIRARQMLRSEDTINLENFRVDTIDGMAPNLVTGDLGLVKATKIPAESGNVDVMALMKGEEKLQDQDKLTKKEVKQKQISISTY